MEDKMILLAGSAAVFSSALTVLVLYIAYRRKIKPYLERLAVRIGDEVEKGVTRAVENKLPAFQDRVKHGLLDGIGEMPNRAPQITSDVIRTSIENLDMFGILKKKDK